MNSPDQVNRPDRTRFRFRLMAYLMVIVSSFTAGALYFAQRKLTSEVTQDQERVFEAEEAALNSVRRTRRAALSERCRNLVHKPRIRAALEDDALDLLYPSAKDELKAMMSDDTVRPGQPTSDLRARFYRFLDSNGSVITPAEATDAGSLSADEEAQLNLANLPQEQQLGYVAGTPSGTGTRLFEIIATPIASSETGEVIAALVIGFDPFGMADIAASPKEALSSGLWFEDRLSLPNFDDSDQDIISKRLSHTLSSTDLEANNFTVETKTGSYRLFHKRLNPDSMYAPAHEISLFSLSDFLDRQRKLRWQILGIGSTLLIAGYSVSRHLATRLSVPVEQLAEDSEKKRVSLEKAETALEQSQVELERSARFSADTSHQLKTPVAVLRAGLEELLARDDLPEEARSDISDFIRQTHRLGAIVEDLLLLSRMDGGRFHLDLAPLNLSQLLAGELDDFEADPDDKGISIIPDIPNDVHIFGEPRYTTMIVRNLLENARKYNRTGGTIRVTVRKLDGDAVLTIGNTGHTIPSAAQAHIFDRFHRGSVNENIQGHGLGLNIARDLARLHRGELRLSRSASDWTEFEVTFLLANAAA